MSKLSRLLYAAYDAAYFQLKRLADAHHADALDSHDLTFTIDLDAGGGLPHVNISGPCALSTTHNRLGVGDIAELAKRAQRALEQPIVDKP